jgi:hypothetical protein
MSKFMCHISVMFFITLFLATGLTYAASPYTFSLDQFSVEIDSVNLVDDFNDGILLPWKIFEPTAYESNGLMTLTNPGVLETFQINNYTFNIETSRIYFDIPFHTPIINGGSDFTASSIWTFETGIPSKNQLYYLESDIENGPIDLETIIIGVFNTGPALADALESFGFEEGLYIMFQIASGDISLWINQTFHFDEDDVTGNIILSLEFDAFTKQYTGAFSLDGGSTFHKPFEPVFTIIDEGYFSKWEFTAESWEVIKPVAIDIKPGSCPNPLNVKSGGVLPVAVLGTADFDVTHIEPESIRLHGVPALRFGFEDVSTPFEGLTDNCGGCTSQGADGFMDMTFKFDKAAVVAALGGVQDGSCVKVALTGELRDEFGGSPIHGSDSVKIRKRGKKENLVFFDDFQEDDFQEKWISGGACGPDTITNVDGRIQATENCNYIETLEYFSGNLRIEVDVEKVGHQDHTCWDFYVELASIQATGAIRFDWNGVDGIGIGYIWETCGDEFVMDPSAPNEGRAVLTYSEPYLHFYFENTDGEVLATNEIPVGSFGASPIRIWLAAHPDTPRYIDNVSIYQLN